MRSAELQGRRKKTQQQLERGRKEAGPGWAGLGLANATPSPATEINYRARSYVATGPAVSKVK